jgi:hypothetical protein
LRVHAPKEEKAACLPAPHGTQKTPAGWLLAAGRNERRERASVRASLISTQISPPFFSPPSKPGLVRSPHLLFRAAGATGRPLALSSLPIDLALGHLAMAARAGGRTNELEESHHSCVGRAGDICFASNTTTTTTTTKREQETAPRGTTNEPSLFAQFVWQPTNSISLSKQISHQQAVNSTFLSEKISTSHQPNEQAAVLSCLLILHRGN